jgi:hypothetical protein
VSTRVAGSAGVSCRGIGVDPADGVGHPTAFDDGSPAEPDPMNRDTEPDVEPLLREITRRGWTLICCGHRAQPDAVAAVNRTWFWADVVVLRGHDRAAAYRTFTQPHDNPLLATRGVWHYLSDAERTLRAVLNLTPNTIASTPYPLPKECRIPEIRHRPLIIRPGRQAHS